VFNDDDKDKCIREMLDDEDNLSKFNDFKRKIGDDNALD